MLTIERSPAPNQRSARRGVTSAFQKSFGQRAAIAGLLFAIACGCSTASLGQTRPVESRKTAIDDSESRAEREAEDLVSLSADKIITLLQRETGLLLQVKKLLVRKAFEQGRVLDPRDLSDDALYRLVQEDENIRVLITHEIEDRYYVRAKPGGEEREQMEHRHGRQMMPVETRADTTSSTQTAKAPVSQEDVYWLNHDQGQAPEGNSGDPNSFERKVPSQEPQRREPINNDPRRQVEMAGTQNATGDFYDNTGAGDAAAMLRVRPEELPGLLTTGISGRAVSTGSRDTLSRLAPPLPPSMELPQVSGSRQLPSPVADTGTRRKTMPYPTQPPLDDHPVARHRANPYADIPSLYDLYSQYGQRSPILGRFGDDVFRNGTGNFDELPMDMPVGPEYVLGPGDGLSIDLWGGVSQRLQRVVDREGRITLPEAGAVQVTGRSLGDVQHMVQTVMRTQFHDIEADVSLAKLRTVRVYVVGDVLRPGAYDVSSLSTPLNALYLAGGPTTQGSLRTLRHLRGKELIQEVDVYELLLDGVRSGIERLQSGDTILVPPLGPEVTVEGMVRRPAVYELKGENTLAEVLEVAGGVLPSGTLRHVDVERVEAHLSRTMLRLDIPENNNQDAVNQSLSDFQVHDGDRIKISPILPYADRTVYLDGHVFHPGKFAYREGMKITDLVQSYHDLLPEPYKRHAEVIRLAPPDYTPTVISFNLGDALAGNEQDIALKPFDTVRIFGRYDFEDAPVITVSGEVRDPGDHVTNGVTYLKDAVYLAGGTTPDALLADVQVFRRTEDGKLKVLSVNLGKALAGEQADNLMLQPKDRIFIHRNLSKVDPPTVTVQGEVARPGTYPLGAEMNASDLVRLAGGLKRGAYTESADLTRYLVEDNKQIVGEHMTIPIAQALTGEADTDARLRDGDVLTIGQLAGWKDVGATITVRGEVLHPGIYGIREGETLSSVITRAGGFRADAYPYGSIFERVQVREIEEKNRAELIRQVQDEGTSLKLITDTDQDEKLAKDAALLQWKSTMEALRNTPPEGRLVIHISADMQRWAKTSADIPVRAGDSIYIPKKPTFVMVDGSVYNPTAVSFKPGKSAGWYLKQAGGPNNTANKKAVFVIRADGSVMGGAGGLFSGGVEDAELRAGDMVVVPQKAFSGTTRWKDTLQVAQLVSAVGIAVQVARGF